MKFQRVSMADVAKVAGVSVATVSRALRNHPSVSMATRERIRDAARELDYAPDPLISSLVSTLATRRRGETTAEIGTIAYVEKKLKRNEFDTAVFEGALERATERGYRLECFCQGPSRMTGRRLSEILFHRGIRGVCLAPLPASRGHVTLEWSHFCCVSIGYTMSRPVLHRVSPHHFQNMSLALRMLKHLGYRRIGICFDRLTSKRVSDNFEAVVGLYRQRYGKESFPLLIFDHGGIGQKRLLLERWWRRMKPDALLGPWPCRRWLESMGVRIPEEAGFAAMGLEPEALDCSGISEKVREIGKAAMDVVIGQIQANEIGLPKDPKVVMVEGAWIDGKTTRPSLAGEARTAKQRAS